MKKRTWLLTSGALLLSLVGGTVLWAHLQYDPLMFRVADMTVRQSDWEQLKPKVFNGATVTVQEEKEGLERRAMEELVLFKAREAGLTVDEATVEKQIAQMGATPEERAPIFAELHLTEEDVKNNHRRALLAFQLKAKMTQDVTVTEQEVSDFYEQNKQAYYAPEFRSVYWLKARADDSEVNAAMKSANAETFSKLIFNYSDPNKDRTASFDDMIGQNPLRDATSSVLADGAFTAQQGQLTGPVKDGAYHYWYLVTAVTPPKQFQLMEVRQKIKTSLVEEKQLVTYRAWLEKQKPLVNYYCDVENVERSNLEAFWHDLGENWDLLL